ncbi:MAG: hypothetical protein M5U27_03640 [Gaiella sp.]|nr:hypothetical protein [Gaiella sp.]
MKSRWGRLVLASMAVVGAFVLVTGGNAGPRAADVGFEAFPGPGQVTYGQQIAYRATFENTSETTLTHVIFRQSYPIADGVESIPVDDTCPVAPVTITKPDGSHVWTCAFGKQSATADPLAVTTVWQVPPQETETSNCPDCLVSNGRWTVKEGVNDVADPNDAFPSGDGIDVFATLLASNSGGGETLKAGGYETHGTSCAVPGASGNLQTNPDVSIGNPVTTTVCLPSFTIPSSNLVDLGYVTQITEQLGNARHSEVCVATLGTNCAVPYVDADFSLLDPPQVITHVFQVAGAALPKGYKITWVSHNGGEQVAEGECDANGFCVVSIDLVNVKGTKTWVIVVTTPTNGYFDW